MSVLAAVACCTIGIMPIATSGVASDASPIYGVKISAGYRQWEIVAPAQEAGSFKMLRGILGNDIAIKAYRVARTSLLETWLDQAERRVWSLRATSGEI